MGEIDRVVTADDGRRSPPAGSESIAGGVVAEQNVVS
jgi:hypothetical protein